MAGLAISQLAWHAAPALSAGQPPTPTQYSQVVRTVFPGAKEQTVTRDGVLVVIDRAPIPPHHDSLGDWPEQPAERVVLNLATHRSVSRILPHGAFDCAHPGTMGGDIGDAFDDPVVGHLFAVPASDLGKGEVNGTPAQKLRMQLDGQTFTVWRDLTWGVALKIRSDQPFFGNPPDADGQTTYYEVKSFTIGTVDPAVFAMPDACRKAIFKP